MRIDVRYDDVVVTMKGHSHILEKVWSAESNSIWICKAKEKGNQEMPEEENKRGFSLLSDYTSYLAFYQGKGTITFSDQETISCTFEAGQLRKGDIFLFCKSPEPAFSLSLFLQTGLSIEHFDGVTDEGFHLSSVGDIIVTGEFSTTELTCWLQTLSVDMVKGALPHQVQFGLTNFLVEDPFSFHLEHTGVTIELHVKPIEQYSNVIKRVKMLKTIDITCELIGSLVEPMNVELLTQVVNNLCYLLSVAQGTKLNWLYQAFSDTTGQCLSRIHHSRVTKAYKPGAIIQSPWVRDFVERTYSAYVTNCERYQFDTRTIDIYLDAKAENDYLQVRGVKLVVALEAIKAIFVSLQEAPIDENIIKESFFKKLKRKLREKIPSLLEEANIPFTEELLVKICEKIPELNRKAFKVLLEDIFQRIHLKIDNEEMARFIQYRNSLVHEGRFFCEVIAQKAKVPPSHREMVQEYFFLVSVLDRVVLKLLGYQGMYIDRIVPGKIIDRRLD